MGRVRGYNVKVVAFFIIFVVIKFVFMPQQVPLRPIDTAMEAAKKRFHEKKEKDMKEVDYFIKKELKDKDNIRQALQFKAEISQRQFFEKMKQKTPKPSDK